MAATAESQRCWLPQPELLPHPLDNLLGGGIRHQGRISDAERKDRLARLRRERLDIPLICVGAGSCGLGAGAAQTMAAIRGWLKEKRILAEVVEVGCIGMCVAEPLVDIQLPGRSRVSFQKITADKVPELLDTVLAGRSPAPETILGQFRDGHTSWEGVPWLDEHSFFAPQTRWVLSNCGLIQPEQIEEYLAHGGYRGLSRALVDLSAEQVCDMVEASGLRGRGGAGFPTGTKWKFARQAPSDQKYLVCNADEGDPGAFMNRALMEGDPHRLVEGMIIAGYAIGASKAFVYVRAEKPLAGSRTRHAIQQARAYGFLGERILGSGFSFDIEVRMGAGAFVCGEETALLNSIEGKRGMPRPRPPFPAIKGLFGKPTVINNVETLSNLPLIMERGVEFFRSIGTEKSKGTKIFALSGKVARTGLVEVAIGTSVRRVVMDVGSGCADGKAFKAVQMGGPSGGCIPESQLDTPIDYDTLMAVGAIMGSGGMVVMDENTCMVDVAKFFMDFIQRESCGKCTPCREGTRRMLEFLQNITAKQRGTAGETLPRDQVIPYITRLAGTIRDASLCGLGQTAPNPVLSTLRWFQEEYKAHVTEGRCPSGVCRELLTYTISDTACTGCMICARKCPSEAITGLRKKVHVIDQAKCIGCGTCLDVCKFSAVITT
jgi:NADH:ubiquinone oxidoreductase subunit F (NADH-binding)/Pyruvate/2-oxoacid:ferredoxin oxidoreductase delta subunit